LGKLPLSGKILASFFQAVTPRTAGFNTINIGGMNQTSLMLTIVLMLIGGSPGGTAGGIKTTTFTIILFLLFGAYQEGSPVVISGRRIPSGTIRKALIIFGLSVFIVFTSTFLILLNQGSEFSLMQVLFEATSAFGTVGLTTGITPKLSNFSRLVIIATMFLGRVGPLTVMMSLGTRKKYATPRFPEEDVAVG